MKKIYILLSLLIILGSCSALHNAQYNPFYYGYNKIKYKDKNFTKTERVNTYELNDNNIKYFLDLGYIPIGFNNFSSIAEPFYKAEDNAKLKGANVMLFSQDYLGTASGSNTYAQLNQGREYQINQNINSSSNINGQSSSTLISNSGYGFLSSNLYGNINTTTTVKTTLKAPDYYTYYAVPYSNDIYSHKAIYYIHPSRFKIKDDKKHLTDLIGGYKVNKVEKLELIDGKWQVVNVEYVNGEIYLGFKIIFFKKVIGEKWMFRDLNYRKKLNNVYIFDSLKYGETRIGDDIKLVSFYDNPTTKYFYFIENYDPTITQ